MTTETIKIPTLDQLRATATSLGFTMGDAELATHLECLLPGFAAYNLVDRMPDEVPVVKYPRTPGSRPQRGGKSFRRLVCEDHGRGCAERQA